MAVRSSHNSKHSLKKIDQATWKVWLECRDDLLGGVGDIKRWKWLSPESDGEYPKNCVDVSEKHGEYSLVCLVQDIATELWCIKSFDPVREGANSGDKKFLVVPGDAAWKKALDSELPTGAISAGNEHPGKFGKMYVGRRHGTVGVAIFSGYPRKWSFYTSDNQEELNKDYIEILSVI